MRYEVILTSDGRRTLTIPRATPVNAYTMGGTARDAGLVLEIRPRGLRFVPAQVSALKTYRR